MRDATEIRQYFLDLLNGALSRLGMYGEEQTVLFFLQHMAFIDEREEELDAHIESLTARGASYSSTRVTGAFRKVTGAEATDKEIASVYAEVAFQMGYLDVSRLLSRDEFLSLNSGLREHCRDNDLSLDEVKTLFGEPSWFTGTNPVWPCVYLYFTDDPEFASVAFDFWNEIDFDEKAGSVEGRFGRVPMLRNVRIHGDDFQRGFTFTPIGRKLTSRN